MGLAQSRWGRADDPRHAAGQRGRDGREAGRAHRWEGSALNDEAPGPGPGEEPDPVPTPDSGAPPAPDPEPRRYPSTIGGAFYIAILLVTLAGLIVASTTDWRLGVRIIAGALTGAAALRLLLPDRDAGMLAVRHRFVDVGLLTALAATLFALTASIPDQPA